MTTTTLRGEASTKSVLKRHMTAHEMAVTEHKLSRDGSMAIMADGHKWLWDDRFGWWAAWM